MPDYWIVYIGTYTGGESEGIYMLHLDAQTGRLESKGLAAEAENPSFLALHPSKPFLYSVAELSGQQETRRRGANAFAIDPATGALDWLNQHSTVGDGACHVTVDREGRNIITAQYGSGTVTVLPIDDDGRLREATCNIQHTGSSVHQRQKQPHAHSATLDAAGRFVFVADLGADKIFIYRLDAARGMLEPNDPPFAELEPGSGPRHFAFHPNGKFAYVINELANTITLFAFDADSGRLDTLQTVKTLPEGFDEESTTAEIRVHPTGRFVYGSNRGHDSIAAFAVDEATGRLSPIGHTSTQGATPRNFNIDPAGKFLLAANQATDNVVVFRIDQQTGQLEPAGHAADVPTPVCVLFMPPATD